MSKQSFLSSHNKGCSYAGVIYQGVWRGDDQTASSAAKNHNAYSFQLGKEFVYTFNKADVASIKLLASEMGVEAKRIK